MDAPLPRDFAEWADGTAFQSEPSRVFAMFSKTFDIGANLEHFSEELSSIMESYNEYIGDAPFLWMGATWVHLVDLTAGFPQVKRKKMQRLQSSLTGRYCQTLENRMCPDRCRTKKPCKLVHSDMAKIFFMLCIDVTGAEEDEEKTSISSTSRKDVSDEDEDNVSDEETISVQEQRALAQLELVQNERILVAAEPLQCFPEPLTEEEEGSMMEKYLPCCKTFTIDGDEYYLLSDIRRIFDLREDEALAYLSQVVQDKAVDIEADDDLELALQNIQELQEAGTSDQRLVISNLINSSSHSIVEEGELMATSIAMRQVDEHAIMLAEKMDEDECKGVLLTNPRLVE